MTTKNDNTLTLNMIKAEQDQLLEVTQRMTIIGKDLTDSSTHEWGHLCQIERDCKKEIERLEALLCPEIGDGVTVSGYSDSRVYTVVSVAKNGKSFIMKEDKSTLDNWKPEILAGGFCGHCTNNSSQKYTYEFNEAAPETRVTLRKNGTWKIEGHSAKNGSRVKCGIRAKFHDYNF